MPTTIPLKFCDDDTHLKRIFFVSVFCLAFIQPAIAADFSGSVVSVSDGDTIEVLHNQRPERIRLHGIDCPEKGQAYGKKAKQATSALALGKDYRHPQTQRNGVPCKVAIPGVRTEQLL